jgi:BirA family transcriptional regulator, biotin operon repressor / biotin---[acetyl-CoA-carboxylase] ligase
MAGDSFFTILDTVDSTNNYAMGRIHDGLAKHGMLWFANEQTAGKGQRGKTWSTEKGKNIAMSLVLEPGRLPSGPCGQITQFHLSAAVALACFEFFEAYAGDETKIKWPNDLFWRDRKAGGILIENKFKGKAWKWAVVGIGINVNQTRFDNFIIKPVSLKEITGKFFNTIDLAKKLHALLMKNLAELKPAEDILEQYNDHLYKINKHVTLKNKDIKFETVIKGVSEEGYLITIDAIEHRFDFGEVEWVL